MPISVTSGPAKVEAADLVHGKLYYDNAGDLLVAATSYSYESGTGVRVAVYLTNCQAPAPTVVTTVKGMHHNGPYTEAPADTVVTIR